MPTRTVALTLIAALCAPVAALSLAAPAEAAVLSGPLQNAEKPSMFIGMHETGTSWVDTNPTPGTVTYPSVGDVGLVEVDGTCVSTETMPSAASLKAIPTGDGNGCLTFLSEQTAEGLFTFRVSHPGHSANGRYLGDGSAGGVLDLISTTPLVLFAIPEAPSATVSLVSTVNDHDGVARAGDTVTYSASVTNVGNVRLNSLAVADERGTAMRCVPGAVDPGKTTTCTSTRGYPLTQKDLDTGTVSNTVAVTASSPRDVAYAAPTTSDSATLAAVAGIAGTLSSDAGADPKVGQRITYTASLTNTGNTTVSDVRLENDSAANPTCATTTVAPGATTDCVFARVLTQEDIDHGSFHESVTPRASAQRIGDFTGPALEATGTIAAAPSLTLAISSDLRSTAKAGDEVSYSIEMANAGNVTLSAVTLGLTPTATTCPSVDLSPGERAQCTVTTRLSQESIDGGSLSLTVDASGTTPAGTVVPLSHREHTDELPRTPKLTVDVTPAPADAEAGHSVEHVVVLHNAGNVTLTEPALELGAGVTVSCEPGPLAPGGSIACTWEHTVTQQDADNGGFGFAGFATAKTTVDPVEVTAPVKTDSPIAARPATSVVLSAETTGEVRAGDPFTVTAAIGNTGNVTLSAFDFDGWTCTGDSFAPGEAHTCTHTSELSQADVDAGTIRTLFGGETRTPAGLAYVVSDAELLSPLVTSASAEAILTATPTDRLAVGDIVTFELAVTNTGGVTLSDLGPGWTLDAAESATLAPCAAVVLAPEGTTSCTATYTIAQDDVDAGRIAMLASPQVSLPDGTTADIASSSVSIDLHGLAVGENALTSDAKDQVRLDEKVTLTSTVRNTGQLTLIDLQVHESLSDQPMICAAHRLAPGATTECVAAVTTKDAHLSAGELKSVSVGHARTLDGRTVDLPESSLSIKTVASEGLAQTGSSQPYAVIVAVAAGLLMLVGARCLLAVQGRRQSRRTL